MLKNIVLIVLITTLIFSFATNFLIIKRYKISNLDNKRFKEEISQLEYLDSRSIVKYTQSILSENRFLKDVYLHYSNYDSIFLGQVIGDELKLIYRFYQESCDQCIEDELNIIKELGERIGYSKIILVGSHDNINGLKAIINRKNILSPFYNYRGKFNLPIEQDPEAIPSFFVLDKNLNTDFVYKTGGNQSIDNPYFTRIIELFRL